MILKSCHLHSAGKVYQLWCIVFVVKTGIPHTRINVNSDSSVFVGCHLYIYHVHRCTCVCYFHLSLQTISSFWKQRKSSNWKMWFAANCLKYNLLSVPNAILFKIKFYLLFKDSSNALRHNLSKFYYVPFGFVNPPPLSEQLSSFICGRWRLPVTVLLDIRMICLVPLENECVMQNTSCTLHSHLFHVV